MLRIIMTLWNQERGFGTFFLLSALSHILLFIVIILISGNNPPIRHIDAIKVDLVSLPNSGVKNDRNTHTKKTSEQAVSVKTKKIDKNPVKPAPKKIDKKPKKKITNIKKEDKIKTDLAKVADAIEKIKKSVASSPQTDNLKNTVPGADTTSGFPSETSGRLGGITGDILDAYLAEVAWRIEQNWFFSGQMTEENRNLQAVLIIEIIKNGEITNISFEKRSGSSYLDQSAYKALLKANPLPPLPDAFGVSNYKLGLTFTPSGIK